MTTIIGAGLSGLIAAHAFPRAVIIEAAPEPTESHTALLRFRSEAVADLVGIEFKRVQVRKGIWFEGAFRAPNIRLANFYSEKVIGRLGDRSIWNLAPVERFIAPENLYEQLVEAVGMRISWDTPVNKLDDYGAHWEPIISTMPLPDMLNATSSMPWPENITFTRSPITVNRFRIKDSDVYQTIYFPEPRHFIYRASITGSLLIVESVSNVVQTRVALEQVADAFGVSADRLEHIGETTQRFGKIAPIDDEWRKHALFELTHKHNVFSLGRFAVWKNILLDDVVHDIAVVRRLMKASPYEQRQATLEA